MTDDLQHQGRQLSGGRYFLDDLVVGDRLTTGSVEVTADLIRHYAELSGDSYALHLDDEAARELGFPSLVAHGILVLGLADGLKFNSPVQFDAIASLGWDMRFSGPVFAGDRIRAEITVKQKRVTSRPDRGIVALEFVVKNQRGEVVQRGTNMLMMRRSSQPGEAAPSTG